AALRVANARQADDDLHDEPEALRADLAIPGLFSLDARVGHAARADDQVVTVEPRQQAIQFADGRLVVGVGEADHFAFGLGDRQADAAPLAAALGATQDTDSAIAAGQLGDLFARAVVAVGADDDLVIERLQVQMVSEVGQGVENAAGLVVGRDDQAQIRLWR